LFGGWRRDAGRLGGAGNSIFLLYQVDWHMRLVQLKDVILTPGIYVGGTPMANQGPFLHVLFTLFHNPN
jgi:hypothetical protein